MPLEQINTVPVFGHFDVFVFVLKDPFFNVWLIYVVKAQILSYLFPSIIVFFSLSLSHYFFSSYSFVTHKTLYATSKAKIGET
jgi:uncharacterized membrane protein YesL